MVRSIVCSNADCKEITLSFSLHEMVMMDSLSWYLTSSIHHSWQLLPESSAKPQPNYIPEPIVENYNQACRIQHLSANASATMSRRCIQGMIHDFCGLSERTLASEIVALKTLVDAGNAPQGVSHDTIDAIDHVRKIGNIGAHMEKDINLVLDVTPAEAQALIGLIELLFKEWYVARYERQARLSELGVVAANRAE